MSALLDAALEYASGHGPVFPVRRDKTPCTAHGFKDATTDEATIRAWWGKWPGAGIATPTGGGLLVIDVDEPDALKKLEADDGPLPPTVEVVTPRPGRHLYFPGEATNSRGRLPEGIHCRGRGGYVLLPPSPHRNGRYEWGTGPDEATIAPAPEWLLELLDADKRNNGAAPRVEGDIPEQQRNDTLTSMAGTMRRRGFSEQGIAAALLVENRGRCKPPLPDKEVRKIAQSVGRYKPSETAVPSLGELAELLGLTGIGKQLDTVRVIGRGGRARAFLHLDDGDQIVLDPLGAYGSPAKLALELALQTGARPQLKMPDLLEAMRLVYLLAEHRDASEVADQAYELACEYLANAVHVDVEMADQASRWRAFEWLHRSKRDAFLADLQTGKRYVRAQWFVDFLRVRTAPGEPERIVRELETLGWAKPGREGRVAFTRPGFKDTLQWSFLVVPTGWEDQ
jgi:hypothetical protein